jgi:predicted permease
MDNLVFSLNATVPIFLMMILGLFFNKIGWMDEEFANKVNKFVFRVPLPVLLFGDLAVVDIKEAWDTKFVIFCFIITLISITIAIGISCLLKDRSIQGEFIQGAYRSSAALLGIAFIQNIYGNSGQAPLMIIGSVPLYNVMAVITLSLFAPGGGKLDTAKLIRTLKGIATNPIILGILTGMVWSLLHLPMPTILNTAVDNLGKTATPLGLMAMGGALKFGKAFARPKPLIACSFLKLVGYEAVFLPLAVLLGFSHDMLVAIIIMLGSATTVSCYIMAKNMDYDGDFTSGVVMTTTLLSSFTMTIWLYICKSLGLI